MPLQEIMLPETGATGVCTQEAFEETWGPLGWELTGVERLTANEVPGESPLTPAQLEAEASAEDARVVQEETEAYGKPLEEHSRQELLKIAKKELPEAVFDVLPGNAKKELLIAKLRGIPESEELYANPSEQNPSEQEQ